MNLNSIIFPAPTDDKTYELYRHKEEIIFIPKTLSNGVTIHIPCLIQKSKKKTESNKFIFYFHGNAEDIFNSNSNIDLLRNSLPYNTVSIEYPGYSIYYQEKSAETIQEDSLIVFDFFVNELKVNPKDIVLCGRSIGSGPAVYLAANRKPGALILISPFKSIRDTAKTILGFFKYVVADRFNNIEIINNVTCPLLLIHGQKDNLIPFEHSIELSEKTGGPYEVLLPETMDHNEFNAFEDFLEPITNFLKRYSLLNFNNEYKKIEIKGEYFEIPDYMTDPEKIKKKDVMSKMLRKILKI